MEIKVELQLHKSFVKIADCIGHIRISLIGGKFTETIGKNFIKHKIISSLKEAGFKGRIFIDGEEYKI